MKLHSLLSATLVLVPGCGGSNTPSFCYRTTPDNVCPEIWSDASCAPIGQTELGYFLRATAFAYNACGTQIKHADIGTFGGDGVSSGYNVVDISLPDNATRGTAFYTTSGGLASISVIPGITKNCGVTWYGPYIANFKLTVAKQACPQVQP